MTAIEFETTVLGGFPVVIEAEFDAGELSDLSLFTIRNGKYRKANWLWNKIKNSLDAERISELAYINYNEGEF